MIHLRWFLSCCLVLTPDGWDTTLLLAPPHPLWESPPLQVSAPATAACLEAAWGRRSHDWRLTPQFSQAVSLVLQGCPRDWDTPRIWKIDIQMTALSGAMSSLEPHLFKGNKPALCGGNPMPQETSKTELYQTAISTNNASHVRNNQFGVTRLAT